MRRYGTRPLAHPVAVVRPDICRGGFARTKTGARVRHDGMLACGCGTAAPFPDSRRKATLAFTSPIDVPEAAGNGPGRRQSLPLRPPETARSASHPVRAHPPNHRAGLARVAAVPTHHRLLHIAQGSKLPPLVRVSQGAGVPRAAHPRHGMPALVLSRCPGRDRTKPPPVRPGPVAHDTIVWEPIR